MTSLDVWLSYAEMDDMDIIGPLYISKEAIDGLRITHTTSIPVLDSLCNSNAVVITPEGHWIIENSRTADRTRQLFEACLFPLSSKMILQRILGSNFGRF